MISVLFETHHLYYLPNFLPIIDEMKSRGIYSLSISIPKTINDTERFYLKKISEAKNLEFLDGSSEDSRQRKLRKRKFDVVIVGVPGMLEKIVSDNSLAIMVYHGIGLKHSYYKDTSHRINIRAIESEMRYKELKSQGETNLLLTGYTKIDPLFQDHTKLNQKNLEDLNLNSQKKTILYAPTFYPSSIEKLIPYCTEFAKKYNLIIKLHGFSWNQKRYKHHIIIAEKISGKGIYLVPKEDYNIIPYYSISDALISDISSTLFEYLALNRPIFQTTFFTPRLKHRIFKSRLRKRLDLDRSEKINFTYVLDNPHQILLEVKKVLNDNDTLFPHREQALKNFLYQTDGKASSRLVDAIEDKNK
ncbi:MAG: hypothetical protein CMG75_00535 [Candidatus Marinimicrobia bacterium]|nr:hypothetical protein [Candidatus Neomarinimicrobiota bacterium]|tara:strand:- start:15303 stop:16382 length:1080 start_codon:yes stop_codon:yes gene_type:complete